MAKKLLYIILFMIPLMIFSQEKSINKLIVSPNPFSNLTTISFNSTKQQPIFISVKNVLGKTVFSKTIEAKEGKNSFPFKRNELKSGMYIYAIQSNNFFVAKRFVIK